MTTTCATRQTGRLEITSRAHTAVAEAMLRDMAYVLSLTRKVRESIEHDAETKATPAPVALTGSALRNEKTALV